jgi:hypothetical protein
MLKVNPRNKVVGARWQFLRCGRELLAMYLLVQLGLVLPGESNRWMEDKMFAMNEQLLGCKTMATLIKRGLALWARDALICTPSG